MIGDHISIKPEYYHSARQILKEIHHNWQYLPSKLVIGIGGESGSGKSVLAVCIQELLKDEGFLTMVIQQDDYFKFPPKSNDALRKENINWVGMQEVCLNTIQKHINQFKEKHTHIIKPIINYKKNSIHTEIISISSFQVLIVEGTYSLSLQNIDFSIFFKANYKDTISNRIKRNREAFTPFIEEVLKIEHHIIKQFADKAQVLIDTNYQIL